MQNSNLKIDNSLILRMVAKELRAEPIYYFINGDKSSLNVNIADERFMFETFLSLHKKDMDESTYKGAVSKLESI